MPITLRNAAGPATYLSSSLSYPPFPPDARGSPPSAPIDRSPSTPSPQLSTPPQASLPLLGHQDLAQDGWEQDEQDASPYGDARYGASQSWSYQYPRYPTYSQQDIASKSYNEQVPSLAHQAATSAPRHSSLVDEGLDDGDQLAALLRLYEQRRDQTLDAVAAVSTAHANFVVEPMVERAVRTDDGPSPDAHEPARVQCPLPTPVRRGEPAYGHIDKLIYDRSDEMFEETTVVERYGENKAAAIVFLEDIPRRFIAQLTRAVEVLRDGDHTPGSKRTDAEVDSDLQIEIEILNRSTNKMQTASFPDEPDSAAGQPALMRWAVIFRIASLLHEAIVLDQPTTKRDIYYKDVALFKSQTVVDKWVDDIIATASLKRADFNVSATAKGLIASNTLRIHRSTGEHLDLSPTNETLIPTIDRVESIEAVHGLDWMLIVEKDAVFFPLCRGGLLSDPRLGPGVLITGKGYPDLATLQMCRALADLFPRARLCALVDGDPHGLDILSVYAHGSQRNRATCEHAGLPLGDRLEWIGVRASELHGGHRNLTTSLGVPTDAMLPLGERDTSMAQSMLKERDMPDEWRRELQRMLMVRRKAEIEVIASAVAADADAMDVDGAGSQSWSGRPTNNRLIEYIVERLGA